MILKLLINAIAALPNKLEPSESSIKNSGALLSPKITNTYKKYFRHLDRRNAEYEMLLTIVGVLLFVITKLVFFRLATNKQVRGNLCLRPSLRLIEFPEVSL